MDVAFILDSYFKGRDNVSIDVFDAYMEIGTNEEIDPNQIVDYRTDAVEEYNETFVNTEELESLW